MSTFLKKHLTLTNLISVFTVASFFVPIVVWKQASYPFVFGKAMLVQITATGILALYCIKLLFTPRASYPRWSWLGFSVFILYIVMLLSAVQGVDFWRSWWDRSERMLGIFAMLHYGALYLVWRSVYTKEHWFSLTKWFVGIGMVPILVALYQVVNPSFLLNLGAERVASTLGNPIFTAGFALFTFFAALYFALTSTVMRWRVVWGVAAFLSIAALFATQTRGAMIGLWVGVLFLIVGRYFLLKKGEAQIPRLGGVGLKAGGGLANVVSHLPTHPYPAQAGNAADENKLKMYRRWSFISVVTIVAVPLLFFALRSFTFVQKIPGVGRLFSTSLEASTGGTRLLFWQTAVDGWRARPLLGWGWENFYDLANIYYNPRLLTYGIGEQWTDNAHNIVFNTLATTGVVGLAAYLLMYGALYYLLFKNYKSVSSAEKTLRIVLASFFTAHLVQNIFVFEDIASYLVFFWLLAGVDIFAGGNGIKANEPTPALEGHPAQAGNTTTLSRFISFAPVRWLLKLVRAALVVVLCIAVYVVMRLFVYLPAKANYIQYQALMAATVDFGKAIRLHGQAIAISPNPYAPELSFDMGQFFLVWLSSHPDFVFSDYRRLANDMYTLGTDALTFYMKQHPSDVRVGSTLALGYMDGFEFWQNPSFLQKAEDEFRALLPLSPRRQTLIVGLGRAELGQNKTEQAIAHFTQARDEAPEIAMPHWYLATAYMQNKNNAAALVEAREAVRLGYTFSTQDLQTAIVLFEEQKSMGDLEGVITEYIKDRVVPSKQVVQAYVRYLNSVGRLQEASDLAQKYL